jgi:GxxExxY protein
MKTTRQINLITDAIIGAAIAVHRVLGPGLLEPTYLAAMRIELEDRGLHYESQVYIPVLYKGRQVGDYRLDLVVEDAVVVEAKSVDHLHPVFEAQVLTYLHITGKRIGLLINFNSRYLKDGIRRFIWEPDVG